MTTLSTTDALAALAAAMPIKIGAYELGDRKVGLVVVDEIDGFAKVGGGNLAPPVPNAQVTTMIRETDALARSFVSAGKPIFVFCDCHTPGKAEPPYLTHCEEGSGEEELVTELKWMEDASAVTIVKKDCINGFVGAIDLATGRNAFVDWIVAEEIEALIVVGICTDICDSDLVVTTLSARNHGMTGKLTDIVVYVPGCSTYDLPLATCRSLGLPDAAAHPQDLAHYIGLLTMSARGAILADTII